MTCEHGYGEPPNCPVCHPRAPWWFPWGPLFGAVLVLPLVTMWLVGCQSMGYDCSTWRQSDGAEYNRAKRDACFPDCPSCGPVLRERNPYERRG